jgi:integrase
MAKRLYGTGHLYTSRGAWYGRWRTSDGKNLNRKVGPLRGPGHPDGLTAPQAERRLRQMQREEELTPRLARGPDVPTVDEVSSSLQRRLRVRGLRPSSLESYESIQRVHVSPVLGSRPVTTVDTDAIEAFSAGLLKKGLALKTVRNMLGFLHQVFEHAIALKLIRENPVRHAEKPGGKKSGANPDIRFLTVSQLEAVIREIPDEIVIREAKPTRKGRDGPSPPPSPDVLGPVLRVIIITAAMTGLRMSELRGLRWRDIDWAAQRVRVRNTYVRSEHDAEGKSELSTKRSVPMTTLLAGLLDSWSQRTVFGSDLDLVFAHPQTGKPLDRSKVLKRFKAACKDAKVPVIRFHDLRHTFGTRLAASGVPLRTIQEFMGHADTKTTQIYVHYARSEHEIQLVNDAFAPETEHSPFEDSPGTRSDPPPPPPS